MSDIIKKAQKANKAAIEELYQANKQRVYYICKLLLCDEKAAEATAVNAFRGVWDQLIRGKVSSEEEFSALVEKKAVNLCKIRLSMIDNKAFKIPQNKNFTITQYANDPLDIDGGACEIILKNLPAIHRVIYVLCFYLKWTDDAIAETLHTSSNVIRYALEVENANVERLSAAASKASEKEFDSITVEQFHVLMTEEEEYAQISSDADESAIISIDNIIEPIKQEAKKRARKKTIKALAISLSIAFVASMVLILVFHKSEPTELTSGENDPENEYEDEYEDEYDYEDELASLPWVTDVESPTHYAVIDIADYGKVTVKLDGNIAPDTVDNFVALSKKGFYNGLTFHRIMEGFMMQGGDPNGDGTGGNVDEDGNEVNIVGEFYNNGCNNYLSHVRGAISMARAYDPNSASSQFFIVHDDAIYLDGDYAVFGYVVSGMDVVDAVCESSEPTDDNGTIPKSEQPIINSITIYTPEEYAALPTESESESQSASESESQSETQN